jgi:ABC-2 type transport system ATP-binding protein
MEEADGLCDQIAIMAKGSLAVCGPPAELKASVGKPDASMDDVFVRYAGSALDSGGNYRDVSRTRRTARRLG